VLVEVLSPSTEEYDRGEKLEHYRQLASLRHHVLVAVDAPRVEVRTRGDAGWTIAVGTDAETVELSALPARIDVHALYQAAAEPTA